MRKILIVIVISLVILLASCQKEIIVSNMRLNESNDTVEINTTWVETWAYITVEGVDVIMGADNTVDVSTLGIQTVTYSHEVNGKTYSISRKVIVVDQIKPVITLNAGVDTVKVGEDWIDGSVSVIDNSNENISVTVSGTVNTNIAAVYEITYSAVDSSGNNNSLVRYVTVVE